MPDRPRLVADTNVLVSRLLSRHSVTGQAVQQAMSICNLIVSSETLQELDAVLSRPKFNTYLTLSDRRQFLHLLRRVAVHVDNIPPIAACRDPKDDKFLALALAGHADLILTGDHDLLVLHPFRGIAILDPRQYLDKEQTS